MKTRINEDFLKLVNSKSESKYDYWSRKAKTKAKTRKRQVELRVKLGVAMLAMLLVCGPVFAKSMKPVTEAAETTETSVHKKLESTKRQPTKVSAKKIYMISRKASFTDETEAETETLKLTETEKTAAETEVTPKVAEVETELMVETEVTVETELETDVVESKSETESGTETESESESETESETEAELETEAESETETEAPEVSDYPVDEDKAVALAQLMWGEARGCSKREQSMIAWTVLNRVDACYDGQSDFWSVLTAPNQFYYYSGEPYEEYELEIARDVLQRWAAEKDGVVEYPGRTLPEGYLYYYGDGSHNYFSTNGSGGGLWFNLGDPYENW